MRRHDGGALFVVMATLLASTAYRPPSSGTYVISAKYSTPQRPHQPLVRPATNDPLEIRNDIDRRYMIQKFMGRVSASWTLLYVPSGANSVPFFNEEHRQLELCLVTLQRLVYWAQSTAKSLQDENITAYVQARLGAKAMLTGKIGGGANAMVVTLASWQLPACLQDLEYYAINNNVRAVVALRQDLTEGLANLVEFDGLDTLTDPSPRSSLTRTQYTPAKGTFVRRLLQERVVPQALQLLTCFDENDTQVARDYIATYYASEMP